MLVLCYNEHMAEKLISDRIIFPSKVSQSRFVSKVKNGLGISYKELAELLCIHQKTLASWKNGEFRMPFYVAIKLAKISGVIIPKTAKKLLWHDHLRIIAHKGGINKTKIYGAVTNDEAYRKNKWREWWEKEGKFQKKIIFERKIIQYPRSSIELAEFIGIMIGDGGIASFHISITLDALTDKDYGDFVTTLVKNLFGITPKQYPKKRSRAFDIIVHSKELVDFCQSLGLPIGNKIRQKINIPDWIKHEEKFAVACLRGLFDTDGSVFIHRYVVKKKQYSYPKISFASRSPLLLESVSHILDYLAIVNRRSRDEIKIESKRDVRKYYSLVGTHNPKHAEKLIHYKVTEGCAEW